MQHAYPVVMLGLSTGIILFATLVALGGVYMIPRSRMAKIKDGKTYARQFAKTLAVVAAAPLPSAAVAMTGSIDKTIFPVLAVLLVSFAVCIYIGTV